MQKTVWAVLLVVVAIASTVGQTAADGEIAGRITDSQEAALPGVRIAISSGDERREAITDNDGRFVVGLLKLGTYRVAVELAGFVSKAGTITLSPTTRRAHIAWLLEVGCIEEDIRVILGAREAAPMVDAIVHVRVKSDNGPLLWSRRPECTGSVVQSYTVEILNAVVRRSGKDDGRTTLQILLSPREVRLKPGGEYLALLWPGQLAGDGLVFPIVSGRISSPAGEVLSGMRVEEALEALGQWSRERRP
jgi:hypothetical protein